MAWNNVSEKNWFFEPFALINYRFKSITHKVTWNLLPDTVLIQIYFLLPDQWRINMATACKNWHRVFQSPCLWRTRYFELGGFQPYMAGRRASKFAESHGAHVKYLCLSCSHPSIYLCKDIQRNIYAFFNAMKTANLIHFELERLGLDTFPKFDNMKGKIATSLARFLRHQRSLQNVDMTEAQFPLTFGLRVLEAVGSASGSSLRMLCIEDFFHTRMPLYEIKRFQNAFAMFSSLSYLYTNYSYLSSEIVESMAGRLAGKLKNICCRINRSDPHFHRISPSAWTKLKKTCPQISLDVWFEGVGLSSHIIPILDPEAPVKEIHMWTGYDENADWQLNATINHIAANNKQIELLALELDNDNETVDVCLVRMLRRCKSLKEFYLTAMISVGTIDEICTLQQLGVLDLGTFHVTTCGLSEIECEQLAYIKEKHLPVIEQKGLDFKINAGYFADTLF